MNGPAEGDRPWGRAWERPKRAEDGEERRTPPSAPGDTHVLGRRVAAHLLDFVLYAAVTAGVVVLAVSWKSSWWLTRPGAVYWLVWIEGILNWVVLQGLTGYSAGKFLARVKVVTTDGSPPGMLKALIRTIPLLIEQWGIVGMFAVLRNPARQRFGDRWAGTYVVRA